MVNAVGLAPTMRRRGANRIKNPGRSLLRSHVQGADSRRRFMTWVAAVNCAGFAAAFMIKILGLVHAVGVEPTATRLSAGALAVRTSVPVGASCRCRPCRLCHVEAALC